MHRILIALAFTGCSFPEPPRYSQDGGAGSASDARAGDAASGDGAPTDAPSGMVTLTVVRTGSGSVQSTPAGITCGGTCTATFPLGTTITLTAAPAQGNQLGNWTGCAQALTCTLTPSASHTITAAFDPLLSPPTRSSHNMVWDSGRQRAVVFGGSDPSGVRRDIWEWDGNRWTDRTKASGGPAGRWDFGMAYDAFRNRVVVFGGLTGPNAYSNETWEWEPATATWTDRTPVSGPTARAYTHITYDPNRKRVLLFGGYGSTGHLGDTWEWDGTVWVNRMPSTAPVGRALGFLTWDTTRNRALLFGGYGGGNRNDTWEWNGTTWVDRTPATLKPAVRNTFQIIHDPVRQVTMLYGGYPPSGPVYADTWLWNGLGQSWVNPMPSQNPGPRVGHAMVFDPIRQHVLLFGGAGGTNPQAAAETWEWNGSTWTMR